jgi:hypothetical protein
VCIYRLADLTKKKDKELLCRTRVPQSLPPCWPSGKSGPFSISLEHEMVIMNKSKNLKQLFVSVAKIT